MSIRWLMRVATLVAGAYLTWTFKNTHWAATSFIAYIIVLVVESMIGDRLRANLIPKGDLQTMRMPRSDGSSVFESSSLDSIMPEDPPFRFPEIFRIVLTVTSVMVLSDFAVMLQWLDFDAAGQSAWMVALKLIATLLGFVVMFVGPTLNIVFLGLYFSDRLGTSLAARDEVSNSTGAFFGWILGGLIGAATWAHLGLIPYLDHLGVVSPPG